jgi:hypothetical protein
MHAALQAMLVHEVQHASYVSQDAYGKPTYAALHTHPARLESRQRKVIDAQGVERISRARVFLASSALMDLKDQVILPDGTSPPILVLREVFAVDGTRSHWECSF